MASRTNKSGSAREDILQAATRIFADKEALSDEVIDQVWGEFGRSFVDVAAECQGIDPQQLARRQPT
jgi:hypothetical protein